MAVKVAKGEMLLDSLLENPSIKAAVLVDDRGYVVEKRGAAACLKIAVDDETVPVATTKSGAGPTENLYLVQAGTDYLVVVFEENLNFERFKESVDSILAEFDLAPAQD